jgi:O-antigen ligase
VSTLPSLPASRAIDIARWGVIVAAVGTLKSPPVAVLGWIVMLVAFLASGQAVERVRRAMQQPTARAAVVMFVFVAIGCLWATVPWPQRLGVVWDWRKFLLIVILLGLFDDRLWKLRLAAVFVGACFVGAIATFVLNIPAVHARTGIEASQLLRNHGTQSLAFGVAAYICLWIATDGTRIARERLTWGVAGTVILASTIFITTARSGYLAVAILAAVFVGTRFRGRQVLIAGVVAIVAVAALFASSTTLRNQVNRAVTEWREATVSPVYTSMGARVTMYLNTAEIVEQHPWIGVGTGGYEEAYRQHIDGKYQKDDWRGFVTADPHNQYLFFQVELGIMGLLLFVWYLWRTAFDRGDRDMWRWVAVGTLLAWAASSLFSSHFKTFAEGHLFVVFVGAMLARTSIPSTASSTVRVSS